jgi:hypothetical protein
MQQRSRFFPRFRPKVVSCPRSSQKMAQFCRPPDAFKVPSARPRRVLAVAAPCFSSTIQCNINALVLLRTAAFWISALQEGVFHCVAADLYLNIELSAHGREMELSPIPPLPTGQVRPWPRIWGAMLTGAKPCRRLQSEVCELARLTI